MEVNVDIMRKKIYAYKNEKTNAAFDLPYRVYCRLLTAKLVGDILLDFL